MNNEGSFGCNLNSVDEEIQNFIPRITVMGIGGAGCNAVNNMIAQGIEGVDFVVANTDAQSLIQSKAERRIQLGKQTTRGFGAGAKPEVGQTAAEESLNEITDVIKNSKILFLTAGMGGGTGSGAIPVIASIAKEKGILTIAIITTPFDFEGEKKKKIAVEAMDKLMSQVDCVITLPNQNLFKIADKQMSFLDAFKLSDNVLYEGVRNITDLIMKPGLINLDFADIRAVMEGQGRTIIGTSIQSGENRDLKAVEGALLNPLLSTESIRGAKGILVNITGNAENLSLEEVGNIMNTIRAGINSDDTNFVFGTCFDDTMGDSLKVAIIVTGINDVSNRGASYNTSNLNMGKSVEDFIHYEEKSVEEPVKDVQIINPFMDTAFPSDVSEDCKNTTDTDNFETEKVLDKVVKDPRLDGFFETGEEKNIQDFIDEEAEKFKVSNEFFVEKDENDNLGSDGDIEPEPPKEKKKNPLSSFFDMIGEKNDDTFFDDVKINLDDDDVKLKTDGLNITKLESSEVNDLEVEIRKEDDNVVFLAGNFDKKKQENKQIDLMEMIKKMEETLEIPAIFKKNN